MSESNFAETFERMLVPMIFRPWGDDLLDRVQPAAEQQVLDVGCGTGIVARLWRDRVGKGGRIVGVDINPAMISVARSRAPDLEWVEANALVLPFPSATFDVVLSQQALQFMPNPTAALREMRRVLRGGGRLVLSTWRPLAENPFFHELHELAAARFGPHVDRRFLLGNAEALVAWVREAGFGEVRAETVTRQERVENAEQYVEMILLGTVAALDDLSETERRRVIQEFQRDAGDVLAHFADGPGVVHPVSANVITARA